MLLLFFMIASVGSNLKNEFGAVRTVGNYVKPKVPKTQFLQPFQLPYSQLQPDCPASLPPPPLHPKLGLTNLIVNSLFTRNPNREEQFAYQLGNARSIKVLEG